MAEDAGIVKDVGKWEWSELWEKEDWWAVWLGFFLLIAGIVVYFPHTGDMQAKLQKVEAQYAEQAQRTAKLKTIAWYQLSDAKKKFRRSNYPVVSGSKSSLANRINGRIIRLTPFSKAKKKPAPKKKRQLSSMTKNMPWKKRRLKKP